VNIESLPHNATVENIVSHLPLDRLEHDTILAEFDLVSQSDDATFHMQGSPEAFVSFDPGPPGYAKNVSDFVQTAPDIVRQILERIERLIEMPRPAEASGTAESDASGSEMRGD
jgi:hypothetical protein